MAGLNRFRNATRQHCLDGSRVLQWAQSRTRTSQESRVCSSGGDLRSGSFDPIAEQRLADDVPGVKQSRGTRGDNGGIGYDGGIDGSPT